MINCFSFINQIYKILQGANIISRKYLYLPIMNNYISFIVCCLLIFGFHGNSEAQVSHGGRPLPLSLMRNTNGQMFKEMPPFDIQEELRIDSLNESDLRSGFRFAYKFMTNYNRYNSGVTFTEPDGTRAMEARYLLTRSPFHQRALHGIRTAGRTQLFLYNEDQTQILGSFNHLNNSELNLLPVSPIQGDRLIINIKNRPTPTFQGRLTVGEVNHGYRSLRGFKRETTPHKSVKSHP